MVTAESLEDLPLDVSGTLAVNVILLEPLLVPPPPPVLAGDGARGWRDQLPGGQA
ncbi:MAG: hypothetical protein R3F62_02400 [Planctomycetota bacterium]